MMKAATTPPLQSSTTPQEMELKYRNKNRGYQQLLVWQDAIELYGLSCRAVRGWPFEMKKIASQAISSGMSHRSLKQGGDQYGDIVRW